MNCQPKISLPKMVAIISATLFLVCAPALADGLFEDYQKSEEDLESLGQNIKILDLSIQALGSLIILNYYMDLKSGNCENVAFMEKMHMTGI